jgi:Na+/phosphate symporter
MSERRARISDARLAELLDQIAMQNAIIRDVQAIISDLDPDTMAYHLDRFFRIVNRAKKTKAGLIERMEAEKQNAKSERE